MSRHGLSIRTLVTLLVVVPAAFLTAALLWLSSATSAHVAGDLARRLVNAASARTTAEIRHYLDDAVRVSDQYTRRLAEGSLDPSDLAAWERAIIRDIQTTPRVAAITFATPDGSSVMIMRSPGGLELGRVKGGDNANHRLYTVDDAGAISAEPGRTESYDGRNRPWYSAAVNALGPTWSPIYTWNVAKRAEDSSIGTGYTRAIRGPGGTLIGVLLVDVTLEGLTTYLKALPLEQTGRVLIIDDQDRMVASSVSYVVRPDGERFALADTHPDEMQDEVLKSAALALRSPVAVNKDTGEVELKRFQILGKWKRAKVTPASPYPGINWRVITILPEWLFMGEVDRTRRNALWIGLAALLGSVLGGLALARMLAKPVEKLSDHVHKIGAGDFDSRLDLRAARELSQLSDELNKAAGGLKHRMELEQSLAVAMEVQKSLLPERDPTPEGLDVAGRTQYCDATGGDYFDFIEARALGDHRTLLVLGDVMGHGVGAALLMATARAALRAHAADADALTHKESGLASLLDRVNRVLAADNRHNRFMTLSLVVVDPKLGTVRWASAGHDPVLICRPTEPRGSADHWRELETADIPLGMDAGWIFSESQRGDIRPGDLIIIGSDGIWEMANAKGELFGKDRMRALVEANAHRTANDIAATLESELKLFRGDHPIKDDVTFVIARVV